MSADPRVSVEAQLAHLVGQVEGIGREIGQMRKDVTGDLAEVGARIDGLSAHVSTTNGIVRRHDMELSEIRVRADERAKAQADHARQQDQRLKVADRRWVRIAWAFGLAVTVLIAGVGWALTLLGA